MTCKDCIGGNYCDPQPNNPRNVEKWCEKFKNKADFVEVVRCGNCNHCEKVIDQFDNDWYFCKKTVDNAEVTASHYCGYGERSDT